MKIDSVHAVAALSHKITPEEVADLVGDDEDKFSLVAVAEASRSYVPPGVANWLRSPQVCGQWHEVLILNEGLYQVRSWVCRLDNGVDAPATVLRDEILAKIRERRAEARHLSVDQTNPRRHNHATATALNRLRAAHADEADAHTRELLAVTGLSDDLAPTPRAARLLQMDSATFRRVVREDIQNKTIIEELAHPKVSERWRAALVELGEQVFKDLGLPLPAESVPRHLFPIRILREYLPEDPDPWTRDKWVRQMTFLTHIRVRIAEQERHARERKYRLEKEVVQVVEDRLRDTYWPEYSKYRLVADEEIEGVRLARVPPEFWRWRDQLTALGWNAGVWLSPSRVRMNASRNGAHITAITEVEPGDVGFYAYQPDMIRWFSFRSANALLLLGELSPPVFLQLLAQVPEQIVVDWNIKKILYTRNGYRMVEPPAAVTVNEHGGDTERRPLPRNTVMR